MKPSEIYYSQDSIKEKFDNGHTIYSTLSVCKKHQYVINKIPRMRVCKKDGKWYTLDNRRLWVFRKLEADGHIKDVKVTQVSKDRLPAEKFTTKNGGESVGIRQPYVESDDDDDDGIFNDILWGFLERFGFWCVNIKKLLYCWNYNHLWLIITKYVWKIFEQSLL